MRKKTGRRAIALFLLAFAFFDITIVDMTSPELCGGEQITFTLAGPIDTRENLPDSLSASAPVDSESDQESHSYPNDEDCFCCCSHVMPAYELKELALISPLKLLIPFQNALPSAHPQSTYRPPRHA